MNWRTSVSAIPRGNPGNLRTLEAMSALAQSASIDPVVVQAAQDAVLGTPERNPDADFAAILGDVRRRMRYTHDPLGAEVVKDPRYVIDHTNATRLPEPMDCDDASTLAGAMLGAIGYPTRFTTVAVDRSRPDEWSHVYLVVRHPDGRWIPLDPIVRNFDVGDEVPAGQLTAPRAYHEGVDPMRGLGCDAGTRASAPSMNGLGYSSRGMADAASDAGYTGSDLDWVRAHGTDPDTGKPVAGFATSPSAVTTVAAAGGAPWYSQLISAAGGFFDSKSKSEQAAAAARIAEANARIAAATRGGTGVRTAGIGSGFFRNPDGSLNVVNTVVGVGVGALLVTAIVQASRRRR